VSNLNYRILPPTGKPFAVSLWFNPETLTSGWRGIVGNDSAATNGWHVALFTPGPGTNNLIFASSGAGASLSVTGQTLLLPGQWHELTVTHDGTQGSLYLDNTLLAQGPGMVPTHDGPIYVGGRVGNYNSFLGRIDDVRAYASALTREQLSLSGYWHLDEKAGSFVEDSSIHGHHARVTDPAAWTVGKEGAGLELSAGQLIIPNPDYQVLPPTGVAFSISFWLRSHPLPNGLSGLMSCGQGTNNGWRLAVEVEASGQTWLRFQSTTTGGTLDLRAAVAWTNDVWTKLDLTYDGGIATLYVNGQKVRADSGAIQGTAASLVVGAAPGTLNYNGAIDELRIYHHERAAPEIGPVATTLWETVLLNTTTNLVLPGSGPDGKPLTFAILATPAPTNGTVTALAGSPIVSYQAGSRRGPDAFAYTVSDGEFTSPPAVVSLSVVQPHWLSPSGGVAQPRDGTSPAQAWAAGAADALDAIWHTNNYYDCFFYAPGDYETTGYKYLQRGTANPGCKHFGSGSDQTTLRLVNIWDAWAEEMIFGIIHSTAYCDGFEVHNMKLDCNAANVPKYTRGEPVWIRIPLTTTARVDRVTLRWSDRTIPGVGWRLGRASEFGLCTGLPAANGFFTNCSSLTSTGNIDVVPVGTTTDEVILQLSRRAAGIDFYALAEIEVAGASVSLPSATIPGGAASQLAPEFSIFSIADSDRKTAWASGPESQVRIVLPLASGTAISQLNLHWNCQAHPEYGQLGPASDYRIQARDQNTGQYYDVPFVRQGRTPEGQETNTFGSTSATNVILTDQLVILLTAREPGVDSYSLREVTMQYGAAPVSMRLPTARSTLTPAFSLLNAFDHSAVSDWACGTQGAVSAIIVGGNNLKFTHLKIVGFGTKAARECFAFYVVPNPVPGRSNQFGNVLVEDCDLVEPATNNADALSAIVVVPFLPATLTNAVVRRCTVAGMRAYFRSSHGIGAIHAENCLVRDCLIGHYYEPDTNGVDNIGPVLLRSNRLVNVDRGVYVASHPRARFDSILCLDNEIVLNGPTGWGIAACDTCFEGPTGTITNLTALRNVIRYAGWTPHPTYADGGLYYSDIQNGVFGNNVIVLGTPSDLRVRAYPSGSIPPPESERCDYVLPPPDPLPPSLDLLLPGYRRAWFDNRSLSGTLLQVRFSNLGVDGPASQQQWTP
jgi:hypothetical protein